MAPVAVVDSSVIIALTSVGELRLLDLLFSRVAVPFEVWDELSNKAHAPEPDALRALVNAEYWPAPRFDTRGTRLHAGETAVIALALGMTGAWVLLDDLTARRVARSLGCKVVGTLGMLLHAKQHGYLERVEPLLAMMVEQGFRLAPELVLEVLGVAGER